MGEEIRILTPEESIPDAKLRELDLHRAGMTIAAQCAVTEKALLEGIGTFSTDLILTCYSLPAFDDPSALKRIKGKSPLIPLKLLLSPKHHRLFPKWPMCGDNVLSPDKIDIVMMSVVNERSTKGAGCARSK